LASWIWNFSSTRKSEEPKELCRLLWKDWSPNWNFDDAIYEKTATAFENEDFVEIVIHSYRHRFGLVEGDPEFDEIEKVLEKSPEICVPSIAIEGGGDGVTPTGSYNHLDHLFKSSFNRRIIPEIGHNIPQEAPKAFADAIMEVARKSSKI